MTCSVTKAAVTFALSAMLLTSCSATGTGSAGGGDSVFSENRKSQMGNDGGSDS